ncbi:MAG: hypothetical protein ACI4JT_05055 [Oscillospiraceae bacterium]
MNRNKFRRKLFVILIIAVAAAGIGAALFFLLSPKKPTLTVNGEDIPVEVSGFCLCEYNIIEATFVGKQGNDIYEISVFFHSDSLSANTNYKGDDYTKYSAVYSHINKAENFEECANSLAHAIENLDISIRDYKPNESVNISISGKTELHNSEFSVNGDLKYCSYDDLTKSINALSV